MSKPDRLLDVRITETSMVNWYNPAQLIPLALRSLLGALFGSYTDRREVEAALAPDAAMADEVRLDFSQRESIWFDYVADLGDGWNSTTSVAWALSRESLQVDGATLPRGDILLMGGDQVYPVASRDEYEQRFSLPYASTLPWVDGNAPLMLAMPGNHDWYDGLTSFLRVFCQQRWIGGWVTAQSRSYFAVRLPQDWWLWSVDIQLEADIDGPQKQYFRHFADQLKAGDKLILCMPKPEWVERGDARCTVPDKPHYLVYLEKLIAARGARVCLTLAGDSHHYAHYTSSDAGAPIRITAGGGGAFVHGTQELAETLRLPVDEEVTQDYRLAAAYPDQPASRAGRWKCLAFWAYSPGFAALLSVVYLLLSWLWQNASAVVRPADVNVWQMITGHPLTGLISLIPFFGILAFASAPPRKWATLRRWLWGGAHGAAHLALALLIWQISAMLPFSALQSFPDALMVLAILFPLGLLLGGTLFGAYLALSSTLSGMHENEVYSALRDQDHKSFLRIAIGPDGLQIHPLKIERVSRRWLPAKHLQLLEVPSWRQRWFGTPKWHFKVAERAKAPWFEPVTPLQVEAIENPIRMRRFSADPAGCSVCPAPVQGRRSARGGRP